MSERIPPLTAEQTWALKDALRRHPDQGDSIGVAMIEPEIVAHAIAYAIQQSQEPSEAEIETVVRAIRAAADKTSNYWTCYGDMARAAIRAIRGFDAEATR